MNQDYRRDDLNVPDFMRDRQSERRNQRASQATTGNSRRKRQEDYERFERSSTTGGSARRTKDKKVKVTHKEKRTKFQAIIISAAVAASLTIAGFTLAAPNIESSLIISQKRSEFYTKVMAGNQCHLPPTEENSNNWGYLHNEISNEIEEKGYDYDEAVFLFLQNLKQNKDWNMDQLIHYSGQYKDYTDFLSQNGYETSEDFQKAMKKKITLESEIEEKNKQLSEMNDELDTQRMQASNNEDMSIGGK